MEIRAISHNGALGLLSALGIHTKIHLLDDIDKDKDKGVVEMALQLGTNSVSSVNRVTI